jgi:hypothetical protein
LLVGERDLADVSFELSSAIGRPRTVLAVGQKGADAGALARKKGAEVVELATTEIAKGDLAARLGDRHFDLIVFLEDPIPDAAAVVRQLAPFANDGGHFILSRGDLAEAAGLELLWTSSALATGLLTTIGRLVDKRGDHPGFVVARRRPAQRKLSLTVGMISMNEETAVGGVVEDIRKNVPQAEVLLVDSSKDRTPEIAQERGARVVRQFPPKGYGPAMQRLLYEATTDVIVTMDCDGTYPANRILDLHALIEAGADLVNATRTRRRPEAMPLPNFVANRVFASAAHLMHGLPTTDLHSGMRAYRTSMLRGTEVNPNGAALPVDLLVVPARLGYRIVELHIDYFHRIGETTLHRFDSTVWTLKRLLLARAGSRVSGSRVKVM